MNVTIGGETLVSEGRRREVFASIATDRGLSIATVHFVETDSPLQARAGELARTYRLSLDGEPLGYVFGLTWSGRFYYLLIGCDYERHGKHSPGLLLYDGIIEDWLRDGGTVFDFTIGDEPFKQDFGTVATPMFALKRSASWRGRLASAAFDAREQLRKINWGRKRP